MLGLEPVRATRKRNHKGLQHSSDSPTEGLTPDKSCRLNRSMQHSSNLLIRLCLSKKAEPLACTRLNLNRAVFSLNQHSRTNLAIETPADWKSGQCYVDPLRPPALPDMFNSSASTGLGVIGTYRR